MRCDQPRATTGRELLHSCKSSVLLENSTDTMKDGDGTCQDTSTCSGFSESGYCDGGSSNQCCIMQSCSAGGGTGTCVNTANGCSGTLYSGACPGDSSVQCCVSGGGGGGGGSDLSAFDISAAQSMGFWSCTGGTFNKAIIRGYQQACSVVRSPQVRSKLSTDLSTYREDKSIRIWSIPTMRR